MTGAAPRFVFVQPHLRFGGAESQTVQILNGLSRRGHPCTLILHERAGGLLGELDPAVEVIALGFRSHLSLIGGALRARSVLRRLPASVVVVRLWSSIAMIGWIARSARQHRYHFYEDLDPRDHVDYIRFGRLKQRMVARVFRKHRIGALANSDHVALAMTEIYGLGSVPQVVPCGIDVDRVRRLAAEPVDPPVERRADAVQVVTVGSLIERKGLRELRSALSGLAVPVDWRILGEGPLASWLRTPRPDDAELWIDLVGTAANPFPHIAAARVMVHGALSESFGMVILESLALGVPVVARDVRGPREIAANLPDAPIELYDGTDAASFEHAVERAGHRATGSGSPRLGRFELGAVLDSWEALAHRGEADHGSPR